MTACGDKIDVFSAEFRKGLKESYDALPDDERAIYVERSRISKVGRGGTTEGELGGAGRQQDR
eukprot:7411204-Pyramimonas_sp.AAC.1